MKNLDYNKIRHKVKTYYEDNLKKDEYRSHKKKIQNEYAEQVTKLFEELLLRKIDDKGKKRYTGLLMKNETSIEKIRNDIMKSQEYFDRIETDVKNIPKQKIKKAENDVSKLFVKILHREADKDGLKRYSVALASGKITEEEIKDEMNNSEESKFEIYKQVDLIPEQERIQYENIITEIYHKFLFRKPDKMGMIRYTLALSNREMNKEMIQHEIKKSTEAIDIKEFNTKENAKLS